MSQEGQPNTILTVYSPFAWIQELTATNTGTFINYPTAQNGPITFPNTITANKVESSFYTTVDNAPLSIGTFVGRTRAINIGTGMIGGSITLGTASVVVNAENINSASISSTTNTALEIGNILNRTADISIGSNMMSGNVIIGSTSSLVKTTNIASDGTLDIQSSDRTGEGRISISCGDERLGNINIGVNTHNGEGRTTGSVNIMNGVGRQEGSFNVLTNAANRGVINLGSTGSNEGGINIYAKFLTGIKISWGATTYSGMDTFLGGYKTDNYTNVGTMSLNTTQQRVVGSISSIVSVGVYQININTTMSTSVLNPYLTFGVYTKTAAPAWVNGSLRATTGSSVASLVISRRNPTTSTADSFTLSISGLLILSSKSYIAVVVGNGDATISQNILFTDSYMSLIRVG